MKRICNRKRRDSWSNLIYTSTRSPSVRSLLSPTMCHPEPKPLVPGINCQRTVRAKVRDLLRCSYGSRYRLHDLAKHTMCHSEGRADPCYFNLSIPSCEGWVSIPPACHISSANLYAAPTLISRASSVSLSSVAVSSSRVFCSTLAKLLYPSSSA